MSAVAAPSQTPQLLNQQVRVRSLLNRTGRIALITMLALTIAVYIATPVMAIRWMQHPFAGAVFEYPVTANFRVTESPFLSSEPLMSPPEDLQHGDTVLAVNGAPVERARDLYRTLDQFSPGDEVVLQVLGLDGVQRDVTITLTAAPVGELSALFILPYVIGLLYVGIGVWVYISRRDYAVGRVFLMLTLGFATVMATVFDLWTTHTLSRVWSLMIPWSGSLLIVFALMFPSELPFVARRPLLRWLPLVPAGLLAVYVQVVWTTSHDAVSQGWFLQYYFVGAAIVTFLGLMFGRGIFARSPSVREQSRVVLGGSLIAFLPFIIWAIDPATLPLAWVLGAFVLFPIVLAYSIVQYSMLDTSRLVTASATYSIMAAAVTVGYGLLVVGLNYLASALFMGSIAATNPMLMGLMAFLLVLIFQPVRDRLQNAIDALLFRSRGEHQNRLGEFRHDLTVAGSLSEVIRLLRTQIVQGLLPTHLYIFLRDPVTGDFRAVGKEPNSRPETDVRFEATSGLAHALTTSRNVLFLELNKPLPPELSEDHARLAILRTPILVPLQGQDRLAGWVAIGNKRSGEAYSVRDLRYVQGLAEQASLAVERAQVVGDLQRRVGELDVLGQLAQAANLTTDPDVLLEIIYTQTSKLIDATNFYIILHQPEIHAMTYAFFLEDGERYDDREGDIWSDEIGLTSVIVRTGRPLRTLDYISECAVRGVSPNRTRHKAWMGVPLNVGNTTLGVMVVGSYAQDVTFSEDDLEIFRSIADQSATAIDKTRLFAETELRARQLATLNEISRELSSTLDLERLLVLVTRSAVDILGAEAGTLYLLDEQTGEIVFRVVEGGAQDLIGTRLPPGSGLVGKAADTKKPVIVNDVLQDKDWLSAVDRETEFQTQSLLSVPMLIQDESIGVLQIINKRDGSPFGEEDSRLLTTFAAQAAAGINNARLYEATDAELARRVDELQELQRIDRELNRTLDLERVIHITLNWALRITGAGAGMIAMLDAEEEGLEILAATGYGQDFLDAYSERPMPLGQGIVGRVMQSGKAEFVEHVAQDIDFMPASASSTVAQITIPILRANRPIGVLVLESHISGLLVVQDFEFAQRLVEHAAVAIENARLVQEVQDANRSKTEFISFIAHELKNPMTSIRGYTDLLKGGQVGAVSDMQVQFLGTIRSNVDRMTRLVSDLSDSARIETGHLRLEMDAISSQAVVSETVQALEAQISDKEQNLIINVPDGLPDIYADHTRIVQVITNLLSNAHKYTPDNGDIEIHAGVENDIVEETGQQQQVIHYWVRDTGIGMSEEDLSQLFTKFFRAQRGKDMASGTGLGLNITRSLIEAHGGRIWVESEVGVGSTFHFTIPVALETEVGD